MSNLPTDAQGSFDPERIIETLNAHGVRYVVIGAIAAIAHGAPVGATFDVDVTPARDAPNLERLSDALRDLGARIRTDAVDGGLPFSHDANSLANMKMLNLTCRHGDFDLAFTPSGTGGYDDLVQGSEPLVIGTVACRRRSRSAARSPQRRHTRPGRATSPARLVPIPHIRSRRRSRGEVNASTVWGACVGSSFAGC
jgi:hypothetical protein